MSEIKNILIVGSGAIGALLEGHDKSLVMNHASAISHFPDKFKISAFIDPSIENLKRAQKKWSVASGYQDFEAFQNTSLRPDIIVISSPDHLHLEHLKMSLHLKPQAIILEKPVSIDTESLQEFLKNHPHPPLPIFVNYSRQYLSSHIEILNKIKNGDFGNFLSGIGYYCRGLFHTGSHLINLLLCLLDKETENITYFNSINDYSISDPSIECFIKFKNGSSFHLKSNDSRMYEIFEIDLFFEKGRIKFDDLGRTVNVFIPHEIAGILENKYITKADSIKHSCISEAFLNLYKNVYDVLEGNGKVICPMEDAARTIFICNSIKNKHHEF